MDAQCRKAYVLVNFDVDEERSRFCFMRVINGL